MLIRINKIMNDRHRGMELFPQEIRQHVPPLHSQEDKGGKAVAYVKFFISGWTWYATEFDGEDLFFGLVDGHCKEMGHFRLSDLEDNTGPRGLPIERDLYFKPMTLDEIAPELFTDLKGGE